MPKKIEEVLLEAGAISSEQYHEVMQLQERTKKPIEDILVDAGYMEEEEVLQHLSKVCAIPFTSIVDKALDPKVVTLLPEDFCRKYTVIPVRKEGAVLYLATRDPFHFVVLDEAQNITGLVVKPVLTSRSAILKKLHEYREHYRVKEVSLVLKGRSLRSVELRVESISDDKEGAEQAPIVNLVNLMLLEGLKQRASDIHIQPEEDGVQIRFRVDGLLHDIRKLPRNFYGPLMSRLKIMAELDIAEKRLPQDGQFSFRLKKRTIDVRVSTLPTVEGEKAVLRLLDKGSLLLGIEYLGFSKELTKNLKKLVHRPNGILMITGPTGSGKTTTLYSILHALNTPDKNITTVENPVEYHMQGIAQVQVQPRIGLDFAQALRSILRQDPDIVLVGEIRDSETARIAVRASLTGHLVLATLHTNDSSSCVARLLDMGAEPYLLATSLRGVLSQRLVRTICPQCKQKASLPENVRKKYGIRTETVALGSGCEACFFTGYHGRECIGELLSVTEAMRELIMKRASAQEIAKQARAEGMETLLEAGVRKVEQGRTTLEEVLRVADEC